MQRVGPYTLLSRIGAGGMAEIFLARREAPGGVAKVVALKRILPHLADEPDFVAMFLDEAQLAARLSHPHIAQIYDFGQVEDSYFIAMEYVPGEDLLTIIRRAREIGVSTPTGVGVSILAAACQALHHAHEQHDERGRPLGIVHRDVTPSNLLVSHDGVVKLVDFGIAKAERRITVTEAGALKGKYAYMSPEYALGQPVDRRSDVFSLGIVGFELLTHRRLFHRESELAVLRAITEEEIPLLRSRRADLPEELEVILARALARDPAQRWQSAQDLELALEDFAARQRLEWGAPAISGMMRQLFGDGAAKRRQRWAIGDLDEGETTEGMARAPSALPDERTLAGPTPVGGRRPPDAVLAVGTGPRSDGPTLPGPAVVAAPPAKAEIGVDTDNLAAVDLSPAPSRWRLYVVIGALALAGVLWLVNEFRATDAGAADDGPGLTPPADPLDKAAPGALEAPRFDPLGAGGARGGGGRPLATAVARPEKSDVGVAEAWLTLEAPAGARVVVDGVELGVAPLGRRKLAAGMHTVTLLGPGKDFSTTFALQLDAGADHVEVVEVDERGKVTRSARRP
jgi:hypothetical protein